MNRAALQRSAIRRLTAAFAASLPIQDHHQIVVEEAVRLTDAASAALCLLINEQDQLDFVAVAGENAEEIIGLRIRVADSLSESVLSTGEPVLLDSRQLMDTGSLFSDFDDNAVDPALLLALRVARPEIRSAAVVPVMMNKRLIGTLVAQNKEGNTTPPYAVFDQEDLTILTMLAELASLSFAVDKTARLAREQGRELAVLYEASLTVAGSLNVQQVMDNVLNALCTHLEYHSAVLFLLNDERTHLFIAAERGLAPEDLDIQLAVETGVHADVLQSGQPLLIEDTDGTEDFFDVSEPGRALSALISPIKNRDEIVGLLQVTSLQRHAYRQDDLKLLSAVAMQAGIAIENAWLYEDAQRQARESMALYDLSQHVNSTLNLDSVLDFVAESVLNLVTVDKFGLLLYDKKIDRLVPRLSRGVDSAAFAEMQPRIGEGIAGWVYEWQTPQAVSDIAADPRNRTAPLEGFGVASTLCVPLHVGDEVIGVLLAMTSRRRLFTVGEMELLYTISNQASAAIFNALQYRGVRARSHEMSRYFRRIAHALGASLDGANLPQLLSDLAIEIMRADRSAVYRVEGEDLQLCASSRFRPSAPPDTVIPMKQGLAGWVARRGQSLVLANIAEDPRASAHGWLHRDHLSSYLGVPLKAGRRTVGVIEIYTQETREFTKEEVQLLSTFARRARVGEKMLGEAD